MCFSSVRCIPYILISSLVLIDADEEEVYYVRWPPWFIMFQWVLGNGDS